MRVIFNAFNDTVVGFNNPTTVGTYDVIVPDDFSFSKEITTQKELPKEVENEQGKYVYLVEGEEVTLTPEEGISKGLEPLLELREVTETVTFPEQYWNFDYYEVVEQKKLLVEKGSLKKLVYYDEDLESDKFSTKLTDFNADLGDGFVSIKPNGKVRTEKIPLGVSASSIELYLEAEEGIKVEVGTTASNFVEITDGMTALPTNADEVYLRFTNTTKTAKLLYAFGILL